MNESRLLGTWRLVSYEARDSEGRVEYPLGENVSGLLIYDDGGNMSVHVMRNDLLLFAANDPAFASCATILPLVSISISGGESQSARSAGGQRNGIESLFPERVRSAQNRDSRIAACRDRATPARDEF